MGIVDCGSVVLYAMLYLFLTFSHYHRRNRECRAENAVVLLFLTKSTRARSQLLSFGALSLRVIGPNLVAPAPTEAWPCRQILMPVSHIAVIRPGRFFSLSLQRVEF